MVLSFPSYPTRVALCVRVVLHSSLPALLIGQFELKLLEFTQVHDLDASPCIGRLLVSDLLHIVRDGVRDSRQISIRS